MKDKKKKEEKEQIEINELNKENKKIENEKASENTIKKKINWMVVFSLVIVFLTFVEIYLFINQPKQYIPIIGILIVLLIIIYLLCDEINNKYIAKSEDKMEYAESLMKSQKVLYLSLKKNNEVYEKIMNDSVAEIHENNKLLIKALLKRQIENYEDLEKSISELLTNQSNLVKIGEEINKGIADSKKTDDEYKAGYDIEKAREKIVNAMTMQTAEISKLAVNMNDIINEIRNVSYLNNTGNKSNSDSISNASNMSNSDSISNANNMNNSDSISNTNNLNNTNDINNNDINDNKDQIIKEVSELDIQQEENIENSIPAVEEVSELDIQQEEKSESSNTAMDNISEIYQSESTELESTGLESIESESTESESTESESIESDLTGSESTEVKQTESESSAVMEDIPELDELDDLDDLDDIDMSDPNKQLSPEEIAALFAAMK